MDTGSTASVMVTVYVSAMRALSISQYPLYRRPTSLLHFKPELERLFNLQDLLNQPRL